MFPVLPSSLDSLASSGVVDFDPEAYIKGTTPRYVGSPRYYLPFEQPLPAFQPPAHLPANMKPHEQPKHDEFKHQSDAPIWKKVVTGGLVAGLLAFGIYKAREFSKNGGESFKKMCDTVKNKILYPFKYVKDKVWPQSKAVQDAKP